MMEDPQVTTGDGLALWLKQGKPPIEQGNLLKMSASESEQIGAGLS
jgi:hypothetical protein